MRVWFNHWFSTSYHLINMMKEKEPDRFYFIGTSTNPFAIYKQACDEFYTERHDVSDEEYLQFCLDFCREHKIDVFVPRHNLVSVISNSERFREIGVKLFAESDAEVVRALDDKFKTYDLLKEFLPERIPEIVITRSITSFKEAVEELSEKYPRICYKLSVDEGARSFRVIDDRIEGISNLYNKPGNKITMNAALKVLENYDFKVPMMVMPFLDDVEISVDCLKSASGNIVLPRYKTNKRYSEVIFDKEIMEECGFIMDRLNLQMPANIQYKKSGGKLFILEINTRMSGGLQLSCKASGINVPMIALYKLLGESIDWSYPEGDSIKVAHIETPICL